jgi:cytidine deaminase
MLVVVLKPLTTNSSVLAMLKMETSAIATMVNAGHKQIAEMVVISNGNDICSPCGACRQRIREFAKHDALIHMYSANGAMKTLTLAELLPLSFGPEHLESVNENK